MFQNHCPEMDNTAERLAQARDALKALEDQLAAHVGLVSAARRRAEAAHAQIPIHTKALSGSKTELTEAMIANRDTDEIVDQVRRHELKLETAKEMARVLTADADKMDREIAQHRYGIGQAQNDVDNAELLDLYARYVKLIVPAIPLARAISEKAGKHNINAEASGYLLKVSHPRIGPYAIGDDGSFSVRL
jgi:hypothetical protein